MSVKQTPKKVMPVSPGRPKGQPNKTTALLKDAILKAAEEAGGKGGLVGYLKTQAVKNPGPFLSLLGKVLPMQVKVDVNRPANTMTDDELAAIAAGSRDRVAEAESPSKLTH